MVVGPLQVVPATRPSFQQPPARRDGSGDIETAADGRGGTGPSPFGVGRGPIQLLGAGDRDGVVARFDLADSWCGDPSEGLEPPELERAVIDRRERCRQQSVGKCVGGLLDTPAAPGDLGRSPGRGAGELQELRSSPIVEVEVFPGVAQFVQREELARVAEIDDGDVALWMESTLLARASLLVCVDVHVEFGEREPGSEESFDGIDDCLT